MKTREQLLALIEEYMHTLARDRKPDELYEPMRYTLEEGGKRLRPIVMLMVADAYGQEPQKALPAAAAVETFHNFTLLHDDIIDNAEIRRGKSSVYKKWGQNSAILSGDAMAIYAYHLLEQYDAPTLAVLLPRFNRMALEVCEGQQYDINFESRDDVTLEEYSEMIRLKTAVIFAASAAMGGAIAGAPEEDLRTLYDFGTELGMAFQLQDDYLDAYGDAELLGKPIGGDIEESKKTFLTISAINEAGDATRRALLATFRDQNLPLSHKISRIKTIYDSLDIPEITRGIVDRHISKANAMLDKLSIDGERTLLLRGLTDAVARRNK